MTTPISPEDLERERVTLLAMKDSGYAEPGGGIDRALSVIARIDLERNRADDAYDDLSKERDAAEAEVAVLKRENERLREALRDIAGLDPYGDWPQDDDWITAQQMASRALAPKPKEPSE